MGATKDESAGARDVSRQAFLDPSRSLGMTPCFSLKGGMTRGRGGMIWGGVR